MLVAVIGGTGHVGPAIVELLIEDGEVAEETYEARDVSDGEPFREYYRKLYDSIVNGKELLVKPEEGRDAIKVLYLALESSRTGRPIPWREITDG